MGHAYYWVAHSALQQKYKSSTYFKGSGWHPTKGLTGKAWSADLEQSTKSIITLVTRASKSLDISETWKTWFRTKESFLGKEVKKSLPYEGTEILTRDEKDYLSTYHKQAAQGYKNLLRELDNPSHELLLVLPDKLREVGKALQPLSESVDKTISHRLSSAYPSNKKERMKARKRPLKEVLSELGITQYIFVMDPLVLSGMKPFRIDNPEDLPMEGLNWHELNSSYERRIRSVENLSPKLAEIARAFQASTFWVDGSENQK
jgi:hypothetical protein